VEGIRQVLPETGEISRVPVFTFLSDAQAGEVPHRLNMRPCASIGAGRCLAACCSQAWGTAVTVPFIAPVIPSGPAVCGWCQNKEG
jgi:hypothetical protein